MWFLLWNEINWHQPKKKKQQKKMEKEQKTKFNGQQEMQTAANWLVKSAETYAKQRAQH